MERYKNEKNELMALNTVKKNIIIIYIFCLFIFWKIVFEYRFSLDERSIIENIIIGSLILNP